MTGATLSRPPARHRETRFSMLNQSPTFGDPRLPPRFWAKVNPNGPIATNRPELGPCWEWVAYRNQAGYGCFKFGGKARLAHRLAFERLIGMIFPILALDHICENPPC